MPKIIFNKYTKNTPVHEKTKDYHFKQQQTTFNRRISE